MNIKAISTRAVTAGALSLTDLLDESIDSVEENSIVVITSKVVSLCENAVVSMDSADRDELIKKESDSYLPNALSRYGIYFTTKYDTLIPSAGIDESNGNGYYVLWPRDPWKTASSVRSYLIKRFNLTNIGVIISDSTCQPLRLGTIGISIAHSGFVSLHNYVGQPDIFGRPFDVSQANIANGLASAAVVTMGEGTEQTPIAVISDTPFVTFMDRDLTEQEISELSIPIEDDLFAPFLTAVKWESGDRGN